MMTNNNSLEVLPVAPGIKGFRPNVAMIIADGSGCLLLFERFNGVWQFPQGGINADEQPEAAMYRELEEETGLKTEDVRVAGVSRQWLSYTVPAQYRNGLSKLNRRFKGQTQRWYLLQLNPGSSARIRLDNCREQEFCSWRKVSYWYPVYAAAPFKTHVYRSILTEFTLPHRQLCQQMQVQKC